MLWQIGNYEVEITIAFNGRKGKEKVCAEVGSGLGKFFCIFQSFINIFFCHCTKYIMLLWIIVLSCDESKDTLFVNLIWIYSSSSPFISNLLDAAWGVTFNYGQSKLNLEEKKITVSHKKNKVGSISRSTPPFRLLRNLLFSWHLVYII